MKVNRKLNSQGTKYYGLHYELNSYHSTAGQLDALNARNLDDAIKEAAEIAKRLSNFLSDTTVQIVEDTVPFKKSVYVYPYSFRDHSEWHGSIVAQFTGKRRIVSINFEGIENPDNWEKFTGNNSRVRKPNSRQLNSGVNLCTFYIDKFNKKELGDLFIKFGEKIKDPNSRELVISQYKDSWENKSVVSLKINDTSYRTSFEESLMAEK